MNSFSNPVRYSYDAAGNRVKREIVISSSPAQGRQRTQTFTDDLSDDYKVKLTNRNDGTILVGIVSAVGNMNGSVEVYNTSGMRLFTTDVADGQALVSLAGHPSGVYILKIDINGKQTSWKITKQ